MPRNIIRQVRLSKAEWDIIRDKMQSKEQCFSDFARECLLKTRANSRKTPINRAFIAELCKWGNNLNQVSRHLNTNKSLDKVALSMLSRIESHLKELKER